MAASAGEEVFRILFGEPPIYGKGDAMFIRRKTNIFQYFQHVKPGKKDIMRQIKFVCNVSNSNYPIVCA